MSKKRGQNEGTIVQRADGRWMAALSLGYVDGKLTRKFLYGKTRAEVSKKLTESQHKHSLGLNVMQKRQTMRQFLEHWYVNVAVPRTRPSTQRSYRQMLDLHILPGLGHYHLTSLSPQVVQAFLNQKHAGGLSPRTVSYLKAILRSSLNQAMKWDLVVRNVAALTTTPRTTRHEIQVLDPEQALLLMESMRSHRFEVLFVLAISTGLRLGEILGLKWEDLDLTRGTLRIERQVQRTGKGFDFVDPKTERARRTVSLPSFLLEYLQFQRAKVSELRLRQHPDRWNDLNLIFPSEVGTPLESRNIRRALAELLRDADLPQMRFHDLRHTCATLLLLQGVPARVVMDILGHSQIQLTLNTYSHVLPALQSEAASKMDALLGARTR